MKCGELIKIIATVGEKQRKSMNSTSPVTAT